MNVIKNVWYLIVVFLLLTSENSCKKEPNPKTSCDDGTCCGKSGYQYKLITTLDNASGDYGNYGLWLKDPINSVKGVLICSNSLSKVEGLASTYIPNDPNPPYKYRIWGSVYENLTAPGIGPIPIYEVRIEKIEPVN